MKKRSLNVEQNVHEAKRSKQEQEDYIKMYGDGVSWLRGSLIGKGSFASVFIANLNTRSRYTSYPSIMAVKSAEGSVSVSLQKEKEVMDNIRGCANVIKCFGEEITRGESNQIVYNLLLEYGSGGTLADAIKSSGGKGLLEVDVKRYARSILKGLSHIHKLGYVHCDLKPDNIMLVANKKNDGFIAKIGDLGLAKRVNPVKKSKQGRIWRGSPMYFSPEAVRNNAQQPPADIWAFGCIVFEMLTGKPLWFSYKGLGINEILRRVGNEKDIDSVIVSSGISIEARSFLKGCLTKKVVRRKTANKLLDHPFLKGLVEDDVNEVDELPQGILDIYSITSSSSLSDDDDEEEEEGRYEYKVCKSSCSDGSSYMLSPWSDRFAEAKLHSIRPLDIS